MNNLYKYHKVKDKQQTYQDDPKGVFSFEDTAISFLCPCGDRVVCVNSPPHEIEFDENNILTITGSIGSTEFTTNKYGYCHFYIKEGIVEICEDSMCCGRELR